MAHTLPPTVRTAVPIYSKYGQHKSFLEIMPQGDRLRVQTTKLGSACLNRFWFMWLRKLILEKTDARHGFAVEIFRSNLVVDSNVSQSTAYAILQSLASEIRPLRSLPLERYVEPAEPRSYTPLHWTLKSENVPVDELIASCDLPRGARLMSVEWLPRHRQEAKGHVVLTYGDGVLPKRYVGMLVELHFALACCE